MLQSAYTFTDTGHASRAATAMQRLRASALLIRRCRPCRQLMLYQTPPPAHAVPDRRPCRQLMLYQTVSD